MPASLLLGVVLAMLLGVQTAQAHPSTFPDVPETDVAHEAIESLAGRGIISGNIDGDFLPGSPLTRGQATKMLVLWRGAEAPEVKGTSFSDVDATFRDYVAAAATRGWLKGYPDGTFGPGDPITREQMAVVVLRSLGLEQVARGLGEAEIDAALAGFLDGVAVSPDARPIIALAFFNGVLTGDAGRINPLDYMTRAQFCLVLQRADALAASMAEGTPVVTEPDDVAPGSIVPRAAASQEAAGSAPSFSADQWALALFMDEALFGPHDSPITGEMVLQNAEWYGVPPLAQLVILAAETSLGDPVLGGSLARHNNFGCMRYHGADTQWGVLSDGRIWVSGLDWYSFPTPDVGMAAWGRYLKSAIDGFYLSVLSGAEPDWYSFAAVYYGRNVAGFGDYVERLESLQGQFASMAGRWGVSF